MPHRAFTIVELLIAIALGAVLIYTAAAGLRSAAQAVTTANRLSTDNALMRAGFAAAHEELDFWTSLDDPADPGRQALRPVAGGRGLPFSRMSAAFPVIGAVPRFPARGADEGWVADVAPRAEAAPGDDAWEADVGWDPSVAWAAHDRRTWFRGNLAEKLPRGNYGLDPRRSAPPLWFGRYALFAATQAQPALKTFVAIKPYPADDAPTAADPNAAYDASYGGVTTARRWHANQLAGLHRALGWYAFCDYLPSNAIYAWCGSYAAGNTNDGGLAAIAVDPAGGFCNGDGGQVTARGVYRQTYATSYALTEPRRSTPADYYRHFVTDYAAAWDQAQYRDFMDRTLFARDLLPLRPAHWSSLTVAVGRFIKNGRFLQMARVRRADPVTGEATELSFAGIGSTLRGARQQRRPDVGWARWDNDGAPVDTNLDRP